MWLTWGERSSLALHLSLCRAAKWSCVRTAPATTPCSAAPQKAPPAQPATSPCTHPAPNCQESTFSSLNWICIAPLLVVSAMKSHRTKGSATRSWAVTRQKSPEDISLTVTAWENKEHCPAQRAESQTTARVKDPVTVRLNQILSMRVRLTLNSSPKLNIGQQSVWSSK